MKRYDIYKPSGIEWLGEIPGHWEVRRVKDISTKVGDGLHGTPNYSDDSIYYFINGNNLQNGIIDFQNARTISQDVFNEIKISFNSQTLFLSINGTIGNLSFYNNEKIAIGKSIAYMLLKSGFNKNFLFYHMLTDYILDSFDTELSGTTIKNLSLKTLRDTFLINPSFSVQTTIANYLDTKTTAIDRKIELLTAKTDKYKALRRSLINERVCRGLNPNVPQKDSGIEWIGMIPKHWEVKRFKDIAYSITGLTYSPDDIVDEGEGVLVLRYSDLFKRNMGLFQTSTVNQLTSKMLDNMAFIVPTKEEQKEIVDYLDTKSTQIDIILNNISEQINKLTQLRKILINDLVTGKIKVTED